MDQICILMIYLLELKEKVTKRVQDSVRIEPILLGLRRKHNIYPSLTTHHSKSYTTDLSWNQLRKVNTDLLITQTNLTSLYMIDSCYSSARFDLKFLASLSRLQRLKLTLPNEPVNYAVFEKLKEIGSLYLRGASGIDCNNAKPCLTDQNFSQMLA